MAAIRWVATVDNHPVQIINLVFGILAHCVVHVLFHVKWGWVPHFAHNLLAEDVETFDGGYQNPWRLINSKAFRRVLLFLANWTQILVILVQLINRAKLVECFWECALVWRFSTWKGHIKSEGLVESVGFVVTCLAIDLRTQFTAEYLENWRLALRLNNMHSWRLFGVRRVQNLF